MEPFRGKASGKTDYSIIPSCPLCGAGYQDRGVHGVHASRIAELEAEVERLRGYVCEECGHSIQRFAARVNPSGDRHLGEAPPGVSPNPAAHCHGHEHNPDGTPKLPAGRKERDDG